MERRNFGTTGLRVSRLGFGAGHIGGAEMSDAEAERLLNHVLDRGINLIDTARAYGRSEERIGRLLAHRRDECVLSTKIGYGIPGHADWTPEIIGAGVREALRLLKTDRLDIVHFHSCPLDVLRHSGVVEALAAEVKAGRVRVAAYSGENEALAWAVASGAFGSIQCSVNVCDQRGIDGPVADAARRGMGVIAKRPLANAPWRFPQRPAGHYAETYWDRWKAMSIDPRGVDWNDLALRFAAYSTGAHACIAGTRDAKHFDGNLAAIERGPLPDALVVEIRAAFRRSDKGWIGQI
jgi:aryl-alcohol dehydrogenase-like predicted oxidoreductase